MLQERIYTISSQKYPFGNEKICFNTFAEYVFQVKNVEMEKQFQKRIRLLMQIKCQNIIQLMRISKKEQSYHLFYKYYINSLETWIRKNFRKIDINSQREIVFQIISQIFQYLTERGIKIVLTLEQIGVSCQNCLKLFISPSFEIIQDFRSLKNYYQTLRKNLDAKFNQILNQQKRMFNLYLTKQSIQKKVAPRNFIIRGNKLIFLDQKRQNYKQSQNLFRQQQKLQIANQRPTLLQSFYKRKRQSSSTTNTLSRNFHKSPSQLVVDPIFQQDQYENNQLDEINEKKILNFGKVKHQTMKLTGQTQRNDKLYSESLTRSANSLNRLYTSQRVDKKKIGNLKITTYHEIQIQAVNGKQKQKSKGIKGQDKIKCKTETKTQGNIYQNSDIQMDQKQKREQQQKKIQSQKLVERFYRKMNSYYDRRKSCDCNISQYLRNTKSKVDQIFKKFEDFMEKNPSTKLEGEKTQTQRHNVQ